MPHSKTLEVEFRFGVKRRLYNWHLRTARVSKGLKQAGLGALVGTSGTTISHYECLRGYPPPDRAEKISEVLDVNSDTLFPAWLREFRLMELPAPAEELSFSLSEARDLKLLPLGEDFSERIDEKVDRGLLKVQMSKVLLMVTPKEREILELRFGLKDGVSRTLDQVGSMFNITRESVRQKEARALRKLRHPSRSRILKDFL